jgi:hypothetical protein
MRRYPSLLVALLGLFAAGAILAPPLGAVAPPAGLTVAGPLQAEPAGGKLRLYRAWRGMPASRFRVSDPLFAERIASLESRSAVARARLQAIRRSGMRVWVVTPDALRQIAPRSPVMPVAWVTLLPNGRDVLAVVDVEWLRQQHATDGAYAHEDFLRDLDRILAHELFVHIGSIGPGRNLDTVCQDPDPVPGALGCSVVQENLFTYSLGPERPFRQEYRTLTLHTESAADAPDPAIQAVSGYFPELNEAGWETTSYTKFVERHGLDADTPFQRTARMLWENGERERVETVFMRFMTQLLGGTAQEAAEARHLDELARPATPTPVDRFRMRELAFVRAGKHTHVREMGRRRQQVLSAQPGTTLSDASARVVAEMELVSLDPESFEEAIETLHRHGLEAEVRAAFGRYVARLEAGEPESAVRERTLRELLPQVIELNRSSPERR